MRVACQAGEGPWPSAGIVDATAGTWTLAPIRSYRRLPILDVRMLTSRLQAVETALTGHARHISISPGGYNLRLDIAFSGRFLRISGAVV